MQRTDFIVGDNHAIVAVSTSSPGGAPTAVFRNSGASNAIMATNKSAGLPCVWAKNEDGNGFDFYAAGSRHYGQASSIRLKTGVEKISEALKILTKLRGVRFLWKETGNPDLGFIAEEVGVVIPEAVRFEENGFASGMSYNHMLPILVEAVKEQQSLIETLQSQLEQLISKTK